MAKTNESIEVYNQISAVLELIYEGNSKLITLMRRARTISVLTNSKELTLWIDKEINGYEVGMNIPKYRKVTATETVSFDYYISSEYKKIYEKLLRTNKFTDYYIFEGVAIVDKYIENKSVVYKGDNIQKINEVDIYSKYTIYEPQLIKAKENILEKLTEQIQSLLANYLEKNNQVAAEKNTELQLIDVLKRFNDYRKHDKRVLENETEVNGEVYKILKPIYPDLIDEEYLKRFGEKNPKVDFAIPSLQILLEDKFIRSKKDISIVQDQLLADIPQYLDKNKDQFNGLLIFIYSKVNISTDFITTIKSQSGVKDVVIAYAV